MSKVFKKYALYGRKWRISLTPNKSDEALVISDSDLGESSLHCTFRLNQSYSYPWYGDVVVYNLDPKVIASLKADLKNNQDVGILVEAGYKDGTFGVCWQGRVWQYLYVRENFVDSVLTIHCVNDYRMTEDDFVSKTTSSGMSQEQKFGDLADEGGFSITHVGSTLQAKVSPRRSVFFGNRFKIMDEITHFDNRQKLVKQDDGTYSAANIQEEARQDFFVVSPKSGLIGIPTQTNQGVNFRCLLDSRLKYVNPPLNIKLESIVRELPLQYGQYAPMGNLIDDGRYKLISVVHVGDTRGNEWYSECQGWVTADQILNQEFKGLPGIGDPSTVEGS